MHDGNQDRLLLFFFEECIEALRHTYLIVSYLFVGRAINYIMKKCSFYMCIYQHQPSQHTCLLTLIKASGITHAPPDEETAVCL